MKLITLLSSSAVLLSTAAASVFTVGPDYRRPDTPAPAPFRDAAGIDWKLATPSDDVPRGEWWRVFGDEGLNALQERALEANQELRASVARVEQARAAAGIARSAYWPSLDASGAGERFRGYEPGRGHEQGTSYRAALDLSWELDLFGRVRRLSESARALAEATLAEHESARLSLTADVAAYYFSLRASEEEIVVLSAALGLRREARDLAKSRLEIGAADELDLARSEAELALTEADVAAARRQREALSNALAVLVGLSASEFAITFDASQNAAPPEIPAGLPAELLERRPDIAAAERTLAAANARIGADKAAFFPAISLTGSGGYSSGELDGLFRWDQRVWSVSPGLSLPLFQGGRLRANLERAKARREEALADYRQSVLVAFREVQDALTAGRLLKDQAEAQGRAVENSRRAAELSRVRYDAGLVSYLDVIEAERTALQARREAARLHGQRYVTRVALIRALGGSWGGEADPRS